MNIHHVTSTAVSQLILIKPYKVVIIVLLYRREDLVFPRWSRGKESACQCRGFKKPGFNPWIGKIPWRRAWQPTPVFLPGESHGQRSLVGYSSWGHKESDMTEWLCTHIKGKIEAFRDWVTYQKSCVTESKTSLEPYLPASRARLLAPALCRLLGL